MDTINPGVTGRGGGVIDPPCYDLTEFCETHKISRSMLYMLWNEGKGPARQAHRQEESDYWRGRQGLA
jgi:hypothetical protein